MFNYKNLVGDSLLMNFRNATYPKKKKKPRNDLYNSLWSVTAPKGNLDASVFRQKPEAKEEECLFGSQRVGVSPRG